MDNPPLISNKVLNDLSDETGTPERRLEAAHQLRVELLGSLAQGKMSPQEASAARAITKDISTDIFTIRKMAVEEKSGENRDKLLSEMYVQLVAEKGKEFDIAGVALPSPEHMRDLVLDVDDNFVIDDTELKIGDDTEESVLL